jgi:hypothetical protein
MVFRAGLRDPCTRDVAKLSESVKIFLRFPKVEQHPKCMDHAILLGKPSGNCFIKQDDALWSVNSLHGAIQIRTLLYRVYKKKLNRFEIALNFAKHLFVSGFFYI